MFFIYFYYTLFIYFQNLNRVPDSSWQSSISILEAILVTWEVHREVSHLLEEHASSIYGSLRLRYTNQTAAQVNFVLILDSHDVQDIQPRKNKFSSEIFFFKLEKLFCVLKIKHFKLLLNFNIYLKLRFFHTSNKNTFTYVISRERL